MNTKTNVLFLLIDSLRYDRTGMSGYRLSPSLFMDQLFERGLSATNAFSVGCPTQFAFPGIFSSTLPLDFGGYEFGIRDRPLSFVESLQRAGYHTGGFITGAWGAGFFGYDRGFDEFHHLFDIRLFLANYEIFYMQRYTNQVASGSLAVRECAEILVPQLEDLFSFLKQYAREKVREIEKNTVPRSAVVHGLDSNRLLTAVAEEESAMAADPNGYVLALAMKSGTSPVFDGLFSNWKPNTAPRSTGAYVLDAMNRWIHRTKAPFFGWAHLIDVHDGNFNFSDHKDSPDLQRRWYSGFRKMRQRIADAGEDYISDLQYDLSVAFVDNLVQGLYERLQESGLDKNTLIVLASDHGSRMGGGPPHSDMDIVKFYDSLVRIPLGFSHPDLSGKRHTELCSSIDMGPTLLDLLGLPVPDRFNGLSMLSAHCKHRGYVNMEHLGRGECDLHTKPINVCLRSRSRKAVFINPPGENAMAGTLSEYYNMESDPSELVNRVNIVDGLDPAAFVLRNIARQRCHQIRSRL